MKLRLVFLFLTFPFLLSAQTKKHKKKPVHHTIAPKTAMQEFYSSRKLSPDSAATPYLYYQVYDWIGTGYKYSGETRKGIDCSGFVSEMYKKVYCIPLSGGSRDIWTVVSPVEKNELKEGDILFFKIKKGQISHVGIYLGNNKFAHASVHSGVIVSDLDEEYYKRSFFKGGRMGAGKSNAEKAKAIAGNEKAIEKKIAANPQKKTGGSAAAKTTDDKLAVKKSANKKAADNQQKKTTGTTAGAKSTEKSTAAPKPAAPVQKPAAKKPAAKPADNKVKLENTGAKKADTKK